MRLLSFKDDPNYHEPHLRGSGAAASSDTSVGLNLLGNHVPDLNDPLEFVSLEGKPNKSQRVSKGFRFSDDEPVRYAVKGFDKV